jgi:N-acyl-D-amino-acid deacylase
VRETGTFGLAEGVRKLTGDPAAKYRIPDRGRIEVGAWADLLLFDPASVGVSSLKRMKDLPGGGTRMLRDPMGTHGVWVNGVQIHDGKRYLAPDRRPGQVLRKFLA